MSDALLQEWFLTNDEILETSLGYLRFWLNSIVVHTINADTNVTAPIYLVGTRKDTVTNSADHVKVSNLLASRFSHHRAWTSVIFPPAADTVDALCFFAVNNVLGRGDEEVLRLSASIEATMKAMPSTRQIVPLPWLAALDELQAAGTGSFSLTAATEIAVNAGVAHVDIVSWLSFLKEMGILLWLDETGLRDIVIMDAISFLVAPATLIICQHTALSAFEATVHQEAVHRECAQRYPSDWIALVQSALLSERLLPVLWQKYWSHKDKLLMLMTKYGLLVPFFQSEEEESAGIARTHLVPSLLPQFDINIREYSQWSDDAYHSCMFVFTVISEFENYSKISAADLDLCGFLPSGLFERVVGKAVSWCQTTSRNGMFNIRNAVLFRNLSVLYYGNQRFRLTLCQNLNCIRLDVEGDAPLVVHNRIFDQISSIIAECMSSLRCFTALVCNTTAHTSTHADLDLFSFAELSRGEAVELCLIPLRLLNHSVINDSALITTVGSLVRKLLSAQDVKRLYEPWLQMPFMQRDKYDIFISYR